jgi:hypothetical protein
MENYKPFHGKDTALNCMRLANHSMSVEKLQNGTFSGSMGGVCSRPCFVDVEPISWHEILLDEGTAELYLNLPQFCGVQNIKCRLSYV